MRQIRLPSTMVIGVLLATMAGAPAPALAQGDPTVAPATTLSADGRTATASTGPTLSVSQAAGLAPEGQTITVSGSGYDENKGLYIALCAIPPTNHAPSPCGGGQDRAGGGGVSEWISSNPPSYAAGLTTPFGPNGSFQVTFSVNPVISSAVDCRNVACAIVTRNDHTRSSDRSHDIFVPVSFAAPGADPTLPPPPTTQTTTTTTTTTTAVLIPESVVSDDGLSVSAGPRTLSVSSSTVLDPSGAEIAVSGDGYSDATGVLVALCAVGANGAVPGPCTSGSAGASAWISSSPPDYAIDLAEPYGDGGAFDVTLTVPAVIDAETDCREVACAITTRPDDASPQDRSQEVLLPVSFAAASDETTTTVETDDDDGSDEVASASDEESSSSTPWVPIAVAVVLVAIGAVVIWRRRVASTDGSSE